MAFYDARPTIDVTIENPPAEAIERVFYADVHVEGAAQNYLDSARDTEVRDLGSEFRGAEVIANRTVRVESSYGGRRNFFCETYHQPPSILLLVLMENGRADCRVFEYPDFREKRSMHVDFEKFKPHRDQETALGRGD